MRAGRVIGETESGADSSNYTVMHSTSIFLMDAEGRYVTHVTSEAKPADIAEGALSCHRFADILRPIDGLPWPPDPAPA